MPRIILLYFLQAQKVFGHYYAHHQELATMILVTTSVVSFLVCCRLEVNQERNDQCGNQYHRPELLMMGTVMPENMLSL